MKRTAVVLLSGGLDSAVTLFSAREKGYLCRCLAFDYGQRHLREIAAARKIADFVNADLDIVKLRFPWRGSSLVDLSQRLPMDRSPNSIRRGRIPSTYVPARNSIFLSIASSYAEAAGACEIFIGAHVDDSSGYPDCGEDYLDAFDTVIRLGTRRGMEGALRLRYPLIKKNKCQIIKLGYTMGVPFELTWSCYSGLRRPCERCDSCVLRSKGFREAGIADPLASSR